MPHRFRLAVLRIAFAVGAYSAITLIQADNAPSARVQDAETFNGASAAAHCAPVGIELHIELAAGMGGSGDQACVVLLLADDERSSPTFKLSVFGALAG